MWSDCEIPPGGLRMIDSAAEFVRLRTSDDIEEQDRSSTDAAPDSVWREVIDRFPAYRKWVAHNKSVPAEFLRELSRDPRRRVRATVARRRATPPDVLIHLATDPDYSVRSSVLGNGAAPLAALRILRGDQHTYLAEWAASRLDPNVPLPEEEVEFPPLEFDADPRGWRELSLVEAYLLRALLVAERPGRMSDLRDQLKEVSGQSIDSHGSFAVKPRADAQPADVDFDGHLEYLDVVEDSPPQLCEDYDRVVVSLHLHGGLLRAVTLEGALPDGGFLLAPYSGMPLIDTWSEAWVTEDDVERGAFEAGDQRA